MSPDDVLIATTVSGMLLAVAYIGLGFRDTLRQRSLELHRREQAGNLQRATGKASPTDPMLSIEESHRGKAEITAPRK